jgi:hypothetical protein
MACVAMAPACDDDRRSGLEALDEARARLMAAPRVVILRTGPRIESYAPGFAAIEERGRVIAWARGRVEHLWQPERRCYTTSTSFERADFRDQRRGAVPEASSASVEGAEIAWRRTDQDRAPDRSGTVRLDGEGRPVLVRSRPEPPTRIAYPAAVRIARPSPLCR